MGGDFWLAFYIFSDQIQRGVVTVLLMTPDEKQELGEVAAYIATLPPTEICDLLKWVIDSQQRSGTESYWIGVRAYLAAFSLDEPDPIPDSDLHEAIKAQVEVAGNYYLQLSILVFQAKKFIRTEAEEEGIKYSFERRSDLLKQLLLEDCLGMLFFYLEGNWESPSGAQILNRIRDGVKFLQGEMTPEKAAKRVDQWRQEDAERLNSYVYSSRPFKFWTHHCNRTFYKYREQLPGFHAYTDAMAQRAGLYTSEKSPLHDVAKKVAMIDHRIREYPGRGPGKSKN